MRRLTASIAVTGAVLAASCVANAQKAPTATANDPYRNFIGDWSGAALLSVNDLPASITIHVTENKKHTQMRWDYTFGIKGEKGYTRTTKWITLKPADGLLISRWKGHGEGVDRAYGLEKFDAKGYGEFVSVGPGEHPIGTRRGTFDLAPTRLSYRWEIEENGKFRVYSRFEFKRDGASPGVSLAPTTEPETK